MGWFFSTLGVAFASAFVPVLNIEAYLGVLAARGVAGVWTLAAAAALGQMAGKAVFYVLGRSSLSWGWVRRRIESPKFLAKLELWQHRVGDRPIMAGAVVLLAASAGLPPLAVVSVVAGSLRVPFAVFAVMGLIGRVLRFAVVLGAVGWFAAR